jgi:uncharacterized protein
MPTWIYADTSAVAKLFLAEPESDPLRQWLATQRQPKLISSELLRVELLRLLALLAPAALGSAERFLAADIDLVEVTRPTLAHSERMPPRKLRTLDAIHLSTAFDFGPMLDWVLSYDKVLLASARNAGIDVASPGIGSSGTGS